ncbi:Wzz/FepE/Etk N-terminal domain-containing protein [Bacillus spongiae]|uniref:Wzz/FepE/Etk N-terminal domain-containing protein n=1 Tax=Bacillus spongiae TaxID=2683610 RepID=A0ABU8HDL4_9BACI
MEETISLKDLLDTLRKRIRLIFTITLITVACSGFITFFLLTPIYQSSTQLLVNKSNTDATFYNTNDIQANLQLINTYSVIMKSPAILEIVIEELKLDTTVEELDEKLTIQSQKDSQVLKLSVQHADAEKTVAIANKTAEVFKREIPTIMNVDNVTILSVAANSSKLTPIKPQPILNIAISLIIGLLSGTGIAFLLEIIDKTVKKEEDIEKSVGIPVIGIISRMDGPQMETSERRKNRNRKLRGETFGS